MLLHTRILFVPSNKINVINVEPINWRITYIKQYMNYGDHHNFIEISLQTKLRVSLVVSSQSSSSCRARRAVLFDNFDTAKMHRLDTSNMTNQVEFGLYSAAFGKINQVPYSY